MTTSEIVAYLKGLAEGMGVEDAGQGTLFKVIIDSLEDLTDGVEEVSDDLAELEEEFYSCECSCCPVGDDEDEEEEAEEDEEEDEDDGEVFYSVKCPGCGSVLTVDEDILDEGEFECPECGEVIDFDTADVEEVEFSDEDEEE